MNFPDPIWLNPDKVLLIAILLILKLLPLLLGILAAVLAWKANGKQPSELRQIVVSLLAGYGTVGAITGIVLSLRILIGDYASYSFVDTAGAVVIWPYWYSILFL